jgi:hypothetical protein
MNYVDIYTVGEYVNLCNVEGIVVNADILKQAGYFCVPIDLRDFWTEAHEFLSKNYPKERYTWTGEKFWFTTAEEALRFYAFYKDWPED